MVALTLPRSLPYMGKLTRWLGAGLLVGAVAATTAAGGYHVSREVAGTGSFAGGSYCRTTTGPLSGRIGPDEVTVWTMSNGRLMRSGPYHLSDPTELANARSTMSSGRVDHVQACWTR